MQPIASGKLRALRHVARYLRVRKMRWGGLVDRPTVALLGEDGPEAVVPLRQPLGTLQPVVDRLRGTDPILRGMSATPKPVAPLAGTDAWKRPLTHVSTTGTKEIERTLGMGLTGAKLYSAPLALATGAVDAANSLYERRMPRPPGPVLSGVAKATASKLPEEMNAIRSGIQAIPRALKYMPWLKDGGIIRKPTLAVVGEAGPELIVPLRKRRRSK